MRDKGIEDWSGGYGDYRPLKWGSLLRAAESWRLTSGSGSNFYKEIIYGWCN
jgi:hypothetical protein